jgi:GNAT superfamily N-acetyltransferase
MELLLPSDTPAVEVLLSDAPHDLAVSAVVAGDTGGNVYVDSVREPQIALVSPHWGRLYLLGRPTAKTVSALRQLIECEVRPAAIAGGWVVFTVQYPRDWEGQMKDVLSPMPTVPAERQTYRWAGSPIEPLPAPEGFTFVATSPHLMARTEIEGLNLLAEEMASERASVDDFLARSFGIAALRGNRLAGWCLSEYNSRGRCEVGIASLEPFQRQGLATAMGRAFLQMAHSRGIGEVGWHCWKKNVASAAAAGKIGLELVADFTVRFGWYNGADAPPFARGA